MFIRNLEIKCKWTSNVTLENNLPQIFHPGFKRKDSVAVNLDESLQYGVVCTKTNLCHKNLWSNESEKPVFHVHVSVFWIFINNEGAKVVTKRYLQFLSSQVIFVGNKYFDLLKQSKLWINYSSLMQCNGKTQLLARAGRNTTDSAIKGDHTFHTHFFVNPYCGIFDAGLTRHWVTFVKLPFSYKKHDVADATYEVFPFNYNGNARETCLELFSNRVKVPTSLKILNCSKSFRNPNKIVLNCKTVRKKIFKPLWFRKNVQKAIRKRRQALKCFREIPTAVKKTRFLKTS